LKHVLVPTKPPFSTYFLPRKQVLTLERVLVPVLAGAGRWSVATTEAFLPKIFRSGQKMAKNSKKLDTTECFLSKSFRSVQVTFSATALPLKEGLLTLEL